LITAGCAALVVVGLCALYLYWDRPGTTTDDVERLVNSHLSTGATTAEIFAFLEAQRITHNDVGDASGYSQLMDAGVNPAENVIVATIPDTTNWPIGRTDIEIYFILDANGRLSRFLVKEINISL
jgi:hypothetical protein